MMTIIVYWNATKFTRYEHIKQEEHRLHEGYLQFILSNGHEMIIPWTTINRLEIIIEDS